MNVYNYLYSFFYRFWESKVGNGRILGAVHVTFALLMHMLFFSEVIRTATVRKIVKTGYTDFPVLRDAYWLIIIGIILVVYFIYTPDRTYRLVREFEVRYGEDLLGNILKMLFYLVIPTVVGVWLAMTGNREFY